MRNSSPQAAAQQPDDVEYNSEATRITTVTHHLRTKGSQHYKADLKTLQAERNTYNGEA